MERYAFRLNGFLVLLVLLVLAAVAVIGSPEVLGIGWIVLFALAASGFTVVNPNEAKVVQFFGRYIGTVEDPGLQWVLPFTSKTTITLRVRNFETAKLKVNDA